MAVGYRIPAEGTTDAPRPRRRTSMTLALSSHPVSVALAAAAVLHLLWWWLVATSGGDLAAQDAWAEFARVHPGSAYNLAWYGGVHPVSYSVLSPYVMAALGVRTTMMLAGTISAGLLALLLVRSNVVRRPLWPALYGALALTGNAVSGRVTFGLGIMFGLAALAAVFAWPAHWRTQDRRHTWPRAAVTMVLSGLATASSPVAGLFIGLVAAGLWLQRRRPAAYALGLPPVAVVALSAWLFPFSGQQQMGFDSVILPVVVGICGVLLAPASWRTVRIGSALYVVGVLVAWVVPSQVGTNVTRLGLLFGGVLLVAFASSRSWPRLPSLRPSRISRVGRFSVALVLAILTSSIWQVATAARDAVDTRPADAWTLDLDPLLHQLEVRDADQARVEVVPAASHREASALAPYVNLARGWNRQADTERNPIFYQPDLLDAASYRAWLGRWAVRFIVVSTGAPDAAALDEADLVAGGLPYLKLVWSDVSWRLYEVRHPTPLADPPAVVTRFDATEVDITVPEAGNVLVRIPSSPWLSLLDEQGQPVAAPESTEPDTAPVNLYGCLSEELRATAPDQADDSWTVLHAPHPGTYRIAAPYKLPRGTTCPDDLLDHE
ncbi:MAG: rane protein [Nocardioides sp.]|nr:rane protein [Nocardioides sp.]